MGLGTSKNILKDLDLPMEKNRIKGPDPDEKWSNLHREREKNALYKWVGFKQGGQLLDIYDDQSDEGVLEFAHQQIVSVLYNYGLESQRIKLNDFVKWKKAQRKDLGTKDEEDVNMDGLENVFQEHDALWRLNKRGVDGETIIHLLLKRNDPKCNAIAKILLNEFRGLAKDVYLGEEQFGESPLHQAIVLGDYDMAYLLAEELKADVNQRALGKFFLPEDQKIIPPKKNTDYKGFAYYGEYPLAFASSFGNKDIYDLLISRGADPNLQDSFGNTVLHMCVINNSSAMYGYAVRHWEKPADVHITNNQGYTPLTLASKLGRKDIFEEMLELMKVEFWRFSDMACSAYPLTVLDTITPDGSTNWDSALMTIINGNTAEHLDMIASEVIQRLLADKWKAYAARKLYQRLFLLIIHLLCMSAAVYLRPSDAEKLWKFGGGDGETVWKQWARLVAELLTVAGCGYQLQLQVSEIRTQGFVGYIKNLRNAPAKGFFLMANIFIILCIPFRIGRIYDTEEALLVFALPSSWVFLLFFARGPRLTGPFVQMIYSMIAGDIFRFSIISLIFLVSFSQAFYFLGKDMNQVRREGRCELPAAVYTYENFPETIMTLFRASMGGYDYEEFACAHYEWLTKLIFILYMIIMPIMLINMLIAMMGNTYTTVISQAEKAWRQQWAQIIMVLERAIGKEKLAKCQMEYSIKLADGTSESEEIRGLMVIKQTKKTKAKQRKTAVDNWKRIGKRVIEAIKRHGADDTERTRELLHSHSRMDSPFMHPNLQLPPITLNPNSPTNSLPTVGFRPSTMMAMSPRPTIPVINHSSHQPNLYSREGRESRINMRGELLSEQQQHHQEKKMLAGDFVGNMMMVIDSGGNVGGGFENHQHDEMTGDTEDTEEATRLPNMPDLAHISSRQSGGGGGSGSGIPPNRRPVVRVDTFRSKGSTPTTSHSREMSQSEM